jgi:gluconate 2-dehydrogenase alpha chain
VTDRFGEVHECYGLYAIGSGGFPCYGGYNPNLTLQAVAYFSAEGLRRKLGVDPDPELVTA